VIETVGFTWVERIEGKAITIEFGMSIFNLKSNETLAIMKHQKLNFFKKVLFQGKLSKNERYLSRITSNDYSQL
jgi:hypothetical protein